MLPGGVAPNDEHTVRVFNFGNRICHSTSPESGGKTCHRGGVSEACAMINIIGSQHPPGEFHDKIVFFVGAFRA